MKILILSQNEVSHNPRLLKAADYFLDKGWQVTVVNGVSGFGEKKAYERIRDERKWEVIENIIDKRNLYFQIRWVLISLVQKIGWLLWSNFKLDSLHILNKGLILANIPKIKFDIILINLVDTLPLASKIKKKTNSNYLIYDSQEYFEGQYQKYGKDQLGWVIKAEREHISNADLIIGTTFAMTTKLKSKWPDKSVVRVRNIPYNSIGFESSNLNESSILRIIWHGMSINYNNCRGVQIIVKALSKCDTNIELTLQGKLVKDDYEQLKEEAIAYGIWDKINFNESVDPDRITGSLTDYDVGVTGELPEEENQILTSSNKLFEYIHAGLCTVVPSLPGIKETIDEYKTGLLYASGNFTELASILDYLNLERGELNRFKANSLRVSKDLIWKNDYDSVLEEYKRNMNLSISVR